jgi:hypothetical protein
MFSIYTLQGEKRFIHKQHVGVGVTQSFGAGITTIRVESVVAPNINVIKKEILIRSVAKLGS